MVFSYDTVGGKEEELKNWLKNTGEPFWRKVPMVKSVKTFYRQFGLGQRPNFQTWLEVDNFASLVFLDSWRADAKRREVFEELFKITKNFNASIVREL